MSRAYAHLLSEDFPLRNKFTRIILKMSEGGISKLLLEKPNVYFVQNPDSKNNFEAPNVKNYLIAFSVMVLWWVFGITVLLIEFVVHQIGKAHVNMRRKVNFK